MAESMDTCNNEHTDNEYWIWLHVKKSFVYKLI